MRARLLTIVLLLITLGPPVRERTLHAQAPAPDAAAVLAAARDAMGGEKRIAGVKTIVATGRTRQVRGDNLVPIEFEIAFEAPNKYVRKDEIPAQETGITSLGFNGDDLIQLPPPATPPVAAAGAAGPNPAQLEAARRNRVTTLKQDFARMMLGLLPGSFEAMPLTFTYVARAEAPQGKADVIEAKGPGNFTARLFVNAETHLPIMVTWQAAGRGAMPPRGGAPGAVPGGEGRAAMPPGEGRAAAPPPEGRPPAAPPAPAAPASPPPGRSGEPPSSGAAPPPGAPPAAGRGAGPGAPAAPIENRLYFADYREVDGLQLPFRIRRAVGSDTVEETTFDRFRVNGKIDPKKFEVRK
jgi:hypothetical protein